MAGNPDSDPSDPARTATIAADGSPTRQEIPDRVASSRDDIAAADRDHDELPTIDPETYVFGRYFARGGMGRIAEVRDRRLGRVIAIKELIARDAGLLARFRREIKITAQLQHPSIVSVLEAGQWPTGEPFFAMKKVAGMSLKQAIDARATLVERLAMLPTVIAIVDALAYAHDRGIIHRDLKPANVLVGEFGETVVIDWGLAKDLRATDDDAFDPMPSLANAADSHMTAAGSILGTPAYMAPEQARGDAADERTDVYALGVILYNVLTGRPPYDGKEPTEIMVRVLDEAPVPVGRLQPEVPGDLQTIVARAMARDPAARYPSAKQLAADLKRFQTGQLVAAHRYTRRQLVMRWIRRHRGAVVVGVAAAVALAALGTASFVGIVRERDRARIAERDAKARSDALVLANARTTVESDPIGALRGLGELSLASKHWPAARLIAADAMERGLPQTLLDAIEAADLDVARDGTHAAFVVGTNEVQVVDLATGTVRSLGEHAGDITDLDFSRDGKSIATSSTDNTVVVWPVDGGAPRTLRGHVGFVIGVGFSPSGSHVISTGMDRTTRLWSMTGDDVRVIPAFLAGRDMSADERYIVASEPGKGNVVWDLVTATRAIDLGEGCAAFSSTAPAAIAIANGGTLVVRDLAGGGQRSLGDVADACASIAWLADGKQIAVGAKTGTVTVWDVAAKTSWVYRGIGKTVWGMASSDDSAWLTAWGEGTGVHVIDVRARDGRTLAGSAGEGRFLADGRIVTLDKRRRLLAWSAAPGGATTVETNASARDVAIAPDGRAVASGGPGWAVRVVDTRTHEHRDFAGHHAPVHHVAWSPNGALIASLSADQHVRLWEVATGRGVTLPGRGTQMVRFSPDGEHLAAAGSEQDVSLWRVSTGELRSFAGHAGGALAVAFSPDGRSLASVGADHALRLWDVATGDGREVGAHDQPVRHVAFSPDGTLIATADETAAIRLWAPGDASATAPRRVFAGHEGWVLGMTFDRGGRHLVTVGTDKTVRVWNVATGEGRTLGTQPSGAIAVAVSPDDRTIATTGVDGSVRLWDVVTGDHRVLDGHTSWVSAVRWLPDGDRLITAGHDATLRIWFDNLPHEPTALRDWIVDITD